MVPQFIRVSGSDTVIVIAAGAILADNSIFGVLVLAAVSVGDDAFETAIDRGAMVGESR